MSGPEPDAETRFLVGASRYVGDLPADDALTVEFVRSDVAHARIARIDLAEAAGAPGVVTVVTDADLDLPSIRPDYPQIDQSFTRTHLARDEVRFVGEPIAAVVARDRPSAVDAAELVAVEYEPLPATVDPERSEAVCYRQEAGDPIDFGRYDVVVEQRIVNQRVAASPMEGRSILAEWEDGHLRAYVSAQGPHPVRDRLAQALGVEPGAVRVVCPDVGGSFGSKGFPHPEEVVVAWLARRLAVPVRWSDHRSEAMTSMGHGRGQVQRVTLAGDSDGTLRAYRLDVIQDAGAYPRLGALLPFMAQFMMSGCYRFDAMEFHGRSVLTNTNPPVPYRGAGRPEAAAALERGVDLFATAAGLDPAEVRRRNLLAPEELPYATGTTATYDRGQFGVALDTALSVGGYDELRAEQRARRDRGDRCLLGIGLASYIEVTSASPWMERARVERTDDGDVIVTSGSSPQGQGHESTWRLIVARELGVEPERIEIRCGDSELFPDGALTAGSRSAQTGGVAVHRAAVALATRIEAGQRPFVAEASYTPEGPTFGSGAHLAVVEVDQDTGKVRVERVVAVDDAGVVLNPPAFHGQVHGGVAQGVAQALYEAFVYGDDGTPLTTNLADYAVPSAAELPFVESVPIETPRDNDLGVSGIGESGAVGSTPAVQNAVVDALAHLGVTHVDLPLTPQRVWQAIDATAAVNHCMD